MTPAAAPDPAATRAAAGDEAPDQRTRIVHTALTLMGEQGGQTVSMRQLAAACGLNVATIYHYFPSKADLLAAVLEDKRYIEQLQETTPDIDPTLDPRARLQGLVRMLLEGVVEEEAAWRLLLGEGLRGEEIAGQTVGNLSHALEETVYGWFEDHFPELAVDPRTAARAARDQVLAFCVEHLALERRQRAERIDERAADLATLLFPDHG